MLLFGKWASQMASSTCCATMPAPLRWFFVVLLMLPIDQGNATQAKSKVILSALPLYLSTPQSTLGERQLHVIVFRINK